MTFGAAPVAPCARSKKAHPGDSARVGGIALWNRGCVRPDPAGGVTKDMPGGAVASGGEVVAPCGMNRP